MITRQKIKHCYLYTIYSPDDGGYYGEVYNPRNSALVYTGIFESPADVLRDAYRIIKEGLTEVSE